MSEVTLKLLDELSDIANETQKFLFVARSTTLQKQRVCELKSFLQIVRSEKSRVIDLGKNMHANLLLGCEYVVNALISELEMLVSLKEGDSNHAWDHLIDAQMHYRHSAQAHAAFEKNGVHFRRLEHLERTLFPPQWFMSYGGTVEQQTCSICKEDYDECTHIKGRPYMGEICSVLIGKIEIDHVSLVDDPSNKHARIVNFNVESGTRNLMTWEIEGRASDSMEPDEKGAPIPGSSNSLQGQTILITPGPDLDNAKVDLQDSSSGK